MTKVKILKMRCLIEISKDIRKATYEYVATIAALIFLVWARMDINESAQNIVAISFAFIGLFIANKLKSGTTTIFLLIVAFFGKTINSTQNTVVQMVFYLAIFAIGIVAIFVETKKKNTFYKERVIAIATGLVNAFIVQMCGITLITILSVLLICFAKLFAMASKSSILMENQRKMSNMLQKEIKKTNSELFEILNNYPEQPKTSEIKTIEQLNYAIELNLRKRVILIILSARKA